MRSQIYTLIALFVCQNFFGQLNCFDAANKYRYDDLLKDSIKSNYPFDSLTVHIKRAQAMTLNCQLINDTFTTVAGKHSSIHNLKGKVLIIDFWSVYCAPCINAFPSFNALLKKYPDKLNPNSALENI